MANPLGGLLKDGVDPSPGVFYVMWYNNKNVALPFTNNSSVQIESYLG